MIPFIEVLDRAHTGPMCEVKDWDIKVIPAKVKEKLKEYGLENTLRPPPKGKDFTQCMSLKTLKPTQEWRKIYETVWEELEDLGVAYREKN